MGLGAVVWLFFLPTLLAIHSAGVVNAFTHGCGPGLFNKRRFEIGDTTTNSWVLAIPTLGSCWHNNRHRYMNTARAGFYWWELDLTCLVLRALALMGLVWDLHPVPEMLVEGRRQARGQ